MKSALRAVLALSLALSPGAPCYGAAASAVSSAPRAFSQGLPRAPAGACLASPAPLPPAPAARWIKASRAQAPERVRLERGVRRAAKARTRDARRAALGGVFDGSKVFITRAGAEPVETTLDGLSGVLDADPGLKESLGKGGLLRLVLSRNAPAGGLRQADAGAAQAALKARGLDLRLQIENVPIDWKRQGAAEASSSGPQARERGRLWRYFLGPLSAPFREFAYLLRAFAGSATPPTWAEFAGGLLSKGFPTALTVGMWIGLYAGHPAQMAAAICVSTGLNLFHGIFVNTWSNFQNTLFKQRGLRYQTIFNLVYGQSWGVIFRVVAWSCIPGTVPPWSLLYWKDIGIATVVGTFCGTLGVQGLNGLYDNGRLTRFQRGAIQQFRDLAMCVAGTFLGAGSMSKFWMLFALQQGGDLLIYALSRKAARRAIVYLADEAVAASREFRGMYPVEPGRLETDSPLAKAWKALLESPFVKPFLRLGKALRGQGGAR